MKSNTITKSKYQIGSPDSATRGQPPLRAFQFLFDGSQLFRLGRQTKGHLGLTTCGGATIGLELGERTTDRCRSYRLSEKQTEEMAEKNLREDNCIQMPTNCLRAVSLERLKFE